MTRFISNIINHHCQIQLRTSLFSERQTNKSPSIFSHKIYVFRTHHGCGHYQITLIFAIFIIKENDHFPFSKILKKLSHAIKFHLPYSLNIITTIIGCRSRKSFDVSRNSVNLNIYFLRDFIISNNSIAESVGNNINAKVTIIYRIYS